MHTSCTPYRQTEMDTCCLFTNQQHRWISFSFFLFSILHKDFFIVLFQAAEARVFDNGFYFCISFHNIIRFVHAQHEDRHGYSYSSVAFLLIVFVLVAVCVVAVCVVVVVVISYLQQSTMKDAWKNCCRWVENFFFISLHKAFVSYLIFFFLFVFTVLFHYTCLYLWLPYLYTFCFFISLSCTDSVCTLALWEDWKKREKYSCICIINCFRSFFARRFRDGVNNREV